MGVVQQLLALTPGDEYLSQNLLHFQPISGHVFSAVSFAGTSIIQRASIDRWHGKVVRVLAHALVATGYGLNTIIATAETVGLLAASLLLSTVHTCTKARFQILQKYTIKAWSGCFNSLAIVIIQTTLLFKWKFSKFHTFNCILSDGAYLGSASLSQITFGTFFDLLANRHPAQRDAMPFAAVRALRAFVEGGSDVLIDLARALHRDFGGPLERAVQQLEHSGSFENFFQQYPAHRSVLLEFTFGSISQEAYRNRLRNMVSDFVQYSHIARYEGQDPAIFVVNNTSQQDRDYQQQLKGFIKAAFKEIHDNDTWAGYIAEDGTAQNGKEALEGFFPHIYQPLAYIAELKELEAQEVVCPAKFSNQQLHQYNTRLEKVIEARAVLAKLSQEEKALLVRKLLQGDSFVLEGHKEVHALYLKIGQLAGSLHQGNLMSEITIDLTTFSGSSNNLFQQACMEAAQEL